MRAYVRRRLVCSPCPVPRASCSSELSEPFLPCNFPPRVRAGCVRVSCFSVTACPRFLASLAVFPRRAWLSPSSRGTAMEHQNYPYPCWRSGTRSRFSRFAANRRYDATLTFVSDREVRATILRWLASARILNLIPSSSHSICYSLYVRLYVYRRVDRVRLPDTANDRSLEASARCFARV